MSNATIDRAVHNMHLSKTTSVIVPEQGTMFIYLSLSFVELYHVTSLFLVSHLTSYSLWDGVSAHKLTAVAILRIFLTPSYN